jgi:hypothetical protein
MERGINVKRGKMRVRWNFVVLCSSVLFLAVKIESSEEKICAAGLQATNVGVHLDRWAKLQTHVAHDIVPLHKQQRWSINFLEEELIVSL